MKVGILSLNIYTTDLNPACRVHSYAFQKFLDSNGIDNVIVDYFPQHCNAKYDMRHPYDYYLAHPKKDEEKQELMLKKWKTLYQQRERRWDKTDAFVKSHLRKTDRRYRTKDLDTLDPGCDIYIAATDVLWKYRDRGIGFDPAFFLRSKCMEGKGKIVFSVSYGGKEYNEEKIAQVKEWTEGIDFVSTREKYLYDLYTDTFGRNTAITLDPVFLHDKDFYAPISERPENVKDRKYVFVYNVIKNSKNILESAVLFAKERGLEVIEMSDFPENVNFPKGTTHEVTYEPGVEEWLGYIRHAEYVFTNSFHCCCFSIIFGKQFYAGNRLGTKVQWLLRVFGLQNRWVEKGEIPDGKEINYHEVNALREKYKKQTSDFILTAIAETEKRLKGDTSAYPKLSAIEKDVVKDEFTITKHYGKDTETQTVALGSNADAVTHRQDGKAEFLGWYSDESLEHEANLDLISTDKVIYAKYEKQPGFFAKLAQKLKD